MLWKYTVPGHAPSESPVPTKLALSNNTLNYDSATLIQLPSKYMGFLGDI